MLRWCYYYGDYVRISKDDRIHSRGGKTTAMETPPRTHLQHGFMDDMESSFEGYDGGILLVCI